MYNSKFLQWPKGVRDSLDVYVSLYIGTGGGFVIANQSVVETVLLELGLVKSDNIAQNIEFTGHSIFYDIHFTTGSFQIEAKSDKGKERNRRVEK